MVPLPLPVVADVNVIQVTSRDGQVSYIGNRTATEPLRVLTDAEVRAG